MNWLWAETYSLARGPELNGYSYIPQHLPRVEGSCLKLIC